jgi:hypothetical protein
MVTLACTRSCRSPRHGWPLGARTIPRIPRENSRPNGAEGHAPTSGADGRARMRIFAIALKLQLDPNADLEASKCMFSAEFASRKRGRDVASLSAASRLFEKPRIPAWIRRRCAAAASRLLRGLRQSLGLSRAGFSKPDDWLWRCAYDTTRTPSTGLRMKPHGAVRPPGNKRNIPCEYSTPWHAS